MKNSKVEFKINVKPNTLEAKVLKWLEETGYLLLDAAFPKKYKAYCDLWRSLFGLDLTQYERYEKKWKRMIYSALARLEEKELITKTKKAKHYCWLLNSRGEKIINQLNNYSDQLTEEDDKIRFFIFDIPEKQRKNRNVIRSNLISFGYKMLQKSVWVGKRPLPRDFLEEIKEMGLWSNIHLFEAKEGGTLDDLEI